MREEDGNLVGTLVVGWDGWRCHLYRLAVPKPSRRRGIGSALLDAAISRARALGADRIDAMVHIAHEPAVAFWEVSARDDEDGRWSLLTHQS